MFEYNKDFYPTPNGLISKLLENVDLSKVNSILEPSAGKGNICDYVAKQKGYCGYSMNEGKAKKIIDTVEIDNNLRAILKDKGYRIIGDDFLKVNTFKKYDLYISNPPFSEGDKHILKMIQLAEQNNGGMIRCICNAETIKNPYSSIRRLLLQKLDEHNATIEYISDGFISAERKTSVEIAIIKMDIEEKESTILLDSLQKAEDIAYTTKEDDNYEVGEQQDFVKAICLQYENECKITKRLLDEFKTLSRFSLKSFDENETNTILKLNVDDINEALQEIRKKYWKTLFQSDKMSKLMTQEIRNEWHRKIEDLKDYDFTPYNINQIEYDIKMSLSTGIESTILRLFDEFTKYNMDDGKNIHMFTGWKTNSAFKIKNKVILPHFDVFDSWNGKPCCWKASAKLQEIEKVFTYIDKGILQMEHVDLYNTLKLNFEYGETRDIEFTYFTATFYKKGTCHLTFKDKYEKVLDRFNYVCCYLRGELPNSYGKKSYKDMTKQEQDVVRSYNGSEKEYQEEVMQNQLLYQFDRNDMLLLGE